LKKYASAAQKSILRIKEESLCALRNFDWPGNVRQLENTIERAVAMEMTDELKVDLEADRPRPRPLRLQRTPTVPPAFPPTEWILRNMWRILNGH